MKVGFLHSLIRKDEKLLITQKQGEYSRRYRTCQCSALLKEENLIQLPRSQLFRPVYSISPDLNNW